MTTYAMSILKGNGLVFKTNANSLEEATEYFRKLKQLNKEEFTKLFIVSEIKKQK